MCEIIQKLSKIVSGQVSNLKVIIYYLLPNIGHTSTHSVSFWKYPSIISPETFKFYI